MSEWALILSVIITILSSGIVFSLWPSHPYLNPHPARKRDPSTFKAKLLLLHGAALTCSSSTLPCAPVSSRSPAFRFLYAQIWFHRGPDYLWWLRWRWRPPTFSSNVVLYHIPFKSDPLQLYWQIRPTADVLANSIFSWVMHTKWKNSPHE